MVHRRLFAVLMATAAAGAASSCRPGTVRIAFRPKPGTHYRYRLDVRAVTVTRLAGQARRTADHQVISVDQSVLGTYASGVQVEVVLQGSSGPQRRFLVTLDRSARLSGLQLVDGLPAAVLGGLGLPEVFPTAVGPPDRPLEPGVTWSIDQSVTTPGSPAAHLKGSGRLSSLGVVHNHAVAVVQTSYTLPVMATAATVSDVALNGVERTQTTTTQRLSDGSVEVDQAHTTATFNFAVPPTSAGGTPQSGEVDLQVDSVTRRLPS